MSLAWGTVRWAVRPTRGGMRWLMRVGVRLLGASPHLSAFASEPAGSLFLPLLSHFDLDDGGVEEELGRVLCCLCTSSCVVLTNHFPRCLPPANLLLGRAIRTVGSE